METEDPRVAAEAHVEDPPQSLRMLPVFWLESLETEDPRVGADTRVVAEAHVEDPPSVHDTRPVSTMSSPVVVEE
mgnify:CR=1 FL=1